MRGWGWALVLGAVGAATAASCSSKKATAIVVSISTEGRVPDEVDQLQIQVTRSGSSGFNQSYLLPAHAVTPGTITVDDQETSDTTTPVSVTVTALKSGEPWTIIRAATLGFSDQKTKLLKMPLRYSCLEFAGSCGAGETCVGGVCQKPDVDVTTLADFDPDAPVLVAAGGACFDQDACVASSAPLMVDGNAASCGFNVPSGDFNVFMSWWTQPSHSVVVEQDQYEGMTIANGRATLAAGLCNAIFTPFTTSSGKTVTRVSSITLSTKCPTKPADLAVCYVPPPDAGGGLPDAGVDASVDASLDAPANSTSIVVSSMDSTGANIPMGASDAGGFKATDVSPIGKPFPDGAPAAPAGLQQAGDLYEFTPATTFASPVSIRVRYTTPLSNLVLLTAEPGAPSWKQVPATKDPNGQFLDAQVTSFSYFVVFGSPNPGTDAGADGGGIGGSTGHGGSPNGGSGGSGAEGGSPVGEGGAGGGLGGGGAGGGPSCVTPTCDSEMGTDGKPYNADCNGQCMTEMGGINSVSCQCNNANPISCFCGNGRNAPACAMASLSDCSYPITCDADLTSDPHNCGTCGHDCQGLGCSSSSCTLESLTFFTPQMNPFSWASDGTSVYYAANGGVYKVPVDGVGATGTPTLLAPATYATALVLDSTTAYFCDDNDGSVWSVGLNGESPTKLATSMPWFSGNGGTHNLAVDADNVYWVVQPSEGYGLVYQVAKTGGPLAILANDVSIRAGVALDAKNVYFIGLSMVGDLGELRSVAKNSSITGGTSTLLATLTNEDQGQDLLAMPDGIYIAGSNGIYLIPYTGTANAPTIVWDPTQVGGLTDAYNLATDGTLIYWTDFEGGRIWSMSPGGSNPRVLTGGIFEPGLMLVDSAHVFINQDPSVLRLPKGLYLLESLAIESGTP